MVGTIGTIQVSWSRKRSTWAILNQCLLRNSAAWSDRCWTMIARMKILSLSFSLLPLALVFWSIFSPFPCAEHVVSIRKLFNADNGVLDEGNVAGTRVHMWCPIKISFDWSWPLAISPHLWTNAFNLLLLSPWCFLTFVHGDDARLEISNYF